MDEIKEIQGDTEKLILGIKKIDSEVEDHIFHEAKKDKVAKEIYKELERLKDSFDKLSLNI